MQISIINHEKQGNADYRRIEKQRGKKARNVVPKPAWEDLATLRRTVF